MGAGKPVTALALHARTQDKALLIAGCDDGSSQVLHVHFPNRYANNEVACGLTVMSL